MHSLILENYFMDNNTFSWTVRAKEQNNGHALCFARQHSFKVGDAVSFDSEYNSISSLEYVLGAVGSELITNLKRLARKKKIEIDAVEVVINGKLSNPFVYLQVIGETGSPEIETLNLKVYISTLESKSNIDSLWQEVLKISPLINTLRHSVQFKYDLKLIL